jgi:hypothetical protein
MITPNVLLVNYTTLKFVIFQAYDFAYIRFKVMTHYLYISTQQTAIAFYTAEYPRNAISHHNEFIKTKLASYP